MDRIINLLKIPFVTEKPPLDAFEAAKELGNFSGETKKQKISDKKFNFFQSFYIKREKFMKNEVFDPENGRDCLFSVGTKRFTIANKNFLAS